MEKQEKQRYFGSVLFFKHIFLMILLSMILVPTILSIVFKVQLSNALQEVDGLTTQLGNVWIEVDDILTERVDSTAQAQSEAAVYEQAQTPEYVTLYPALYAQNEWAATEVADKTVYLTFDDGPSAVTEEILAVLEAADVQATFFVEGSALESEENQAILQRIAAAGHTIGVHTDSHDYQGIYASVEDYLADFYQVWQKIKEITGQEAQIFRFPGGSINAYNSGIYMELIAEMSRRGFVYYDWNLSAQDAATGGLSATQIVTNATAHEQTNRVILLMHDSADKTTTAQALAEVIAQYKEDGYSFAALTEEVKPIIFGYQ